MRQWIQHNNQTAGTYTIWKGPICEKELKEIIRNPFIVKIGEIKENDIVGFGNIEQPIYRTPQIKKAKAIVSANTILLRYATILLALIDKRYSQNYKAPLKFIQHEGYTNASGIFTDWWRTQPQQKTKEKLLKWIGKHQNSKNDATQENVKKICIDGRNYTEKAEDRILKHLDKAEYMACANNAQQLTILTEIQLKKEIEAFVSFLGFSPLDWQNFLIKTANNRKPGRSRNAWVTSDGRYHYTETKANDYQTQLNDQCTIILKNLN